MGYDLKKSTSKVYKEFKLSLSEECMKRFMQTEHLRWNAERTIAGYKEGEVRDSVYKIYPHIRPYCELSKEVLSLLSVGHITLVWLKWQTECI